MVLSVYEYESMDGVSFMAFESHTFEGTPKMVTNGGHNGMELVFNTKIQKMEK